MRVKQLTIDQLAAQGIIDKFRKLIPEELKENKNVRAHSYGIGIWQVSDYRVGKPIDPIQKMLKRRNLNLQAGKHMGLIHKMLTKHNIEYTIEFSDAACVCRFKISKKASNLNKI